MDETEAVPAPARLLRDFVNAREPQTGEESWTGVDQLGDWLRAHGLLRSAAALRPSDLDTAVAVREGLRSLMLDHAGHGSEPAAIAAYNQALGTLALRLEWVDGAHRLRPADDAPATDALARVLDAVRQCERDGTWARLKACARDTCRWAFYDASRNQTRRWCSMAGCGNHVKMKRAYARRRGRHDDGTS